MKKMNVLKIKWFWISLITSVLMIISIPLIPISAANDIIWLLAVSIVFTVHGFYGSVFYWLSYAAKRENYNILSLIETGHIYNAFDLSIQTGKSEKYIVEKIRFYIFNGYLNGYFFDGQTLEKQVYEDAKPSVQTDTCRFCGAPLTLTDGKGKCEYCGIAVQK